MSTISLSVQQAVEIYANLLAWSLPICLVFKFGNMLVSTFLGAAFHGTLRFD